MGFTAELGLYVPDLGGLLQGTMNPVTRALARRLEDDHLRAFIAHWDALEVLVIRVFRVKEATPEDEAEYRRLRSWLQENYPRWQEALRPHWQQAMMAGEVAQEDPFARVMAASQARDFVGNWPAMQALPAAREAINRLLVELLDKEKP